MITITEQEYEDICTGFNAHTRIAIRIQQDLANQLATCRQLNEELKKEAGILRGELQSFKEDMKQPVPVPGTVYKQPI